MPELTRIAFMHDAPHYAFDVSMEDIERYIKNDKFFTVDRYYSYRLEGKCTINPRTIAYFYQDSTCNTAEQTE